MSRLRNARLAEEMGRSCLSTRARYLSRVISGIYDEELRPVGIKASQLNVLVAIAGLGPVRRTDLGRFMHLDSSTLTRNLRVMETNGWIGDMFDDSDGRGNPVQISPVGESLLEKAAPAWRSAQRRAARLLGSSGASSLLALASGIEL